MPSRWLVLTAVRTAPAHMPASALSTPACALSFVPTSQNGRVTPYSTLQLVTLARYPPNQGVSPPRQVHNDRGARRQASRTVSGGRGWPADGPISGRMYEMHRLIPEWGRS